MHYYPPTHHVEIMYSVCTTQARRTQSSQKVYHCNISSVVKWQIANDAKRISEKRNATQREKFIIHYIYYIYEKDRKHFFPFLIRLQREQHKSCPFVLARVFHRNANIPLKFKTRTQLLQSFLNKCIEQNLPTNGGKY